MFCEVFAVVVVELAITTRVLLPFASRVDPSLSLIFYCWCFYNDGAQLYLFVCIYSSWLVLLVKVIYDKVSSWLDLSQLQWWVAIQGVSNENNQKDVVGTACRTLPKVLVRFLWNCGTLEPWKWVFRISAMLIFISMLFFRSRPHLIKCIKIDIKIIFISFKNVFNNRY